jgi:hypothetical protein
MVRLNIRARGMGALIVGLLLSSGAIASPPAAAKIVILRCAAPGETIHLQACDKSAGVESPCPALGSSCAEALALFESVPNNLNLLFVSPAAVGGFWYTLGAKKYE